MLASNSLSLVEKSAAVSMGWQGGSHTKAGRAPRLPSSNAQSLPSPCQRCSLSAVVWPERTYVGGWPQRGGDMRGPPVSFILIMALFEHSNLADGRWLFEYVQMRHQHTETHDACCSAPRGGHRSGPDLFHAQSFSLHLKKLESGWKSSGCMIYRRGMAWGTWDILELSTSRQR